MSDAEITALLKSAKTIAVVGLSNSPARASYGVSRFLQRQGFRVVPVNPNESEVLGERAYPSVSAIIEPVDIVDIFRRPEYVPAIVDEAISRGAGCIWMQEGVVSPEGEAGGRHSRGDGSLYFEGTGSSSASKFVIGGLKHPDRRYSLACAMVLLMGLAACNNETGETTPQAYVAPATVNLRAQLNQKNGTVAVLKHGDSVTIVDVRRRYVKVRSANGAEGWLDSSDLLRPQDMSRIQKDRERARAMPVEAYATVYESSNLHLDPNRTSPSFAQLTEGNPVDVLARKVVPRATSFVRPPVPFERPKPPARHKASARVSNRPPKPSAPKPPADWEAVWGQNESGETEPAAKINTKAANEHKAPVVMDAWNLVRTKDKKSGWVLSRNLMMSIPDDVAQYAEGKRITGYFELGTVNDDERGVKHNWLWTTVSGIEPYDFDSWRVFLWSKHRHRFETSYRQRSVEGYFPVHVSLESGNRASFELVTKDEDGKMRRRTYSFDGSLVHLRSTEDYGSSATQSITVTKGTAQPQASGGWLSRTWQAVKQKLFRSS